MDQIRAALADFEAGRRPGSELVRLIDDLVSEDLVQDLPAAANIMEFQDLAAYYVADPEARKEYAGYIGDDKLREAAAELSKRLQNLA